MKMDIFGTSTQLLEHALGWIGFLHSDRNELGGNRARLALDHVHVAHRLVYALVAHPLHQLPRVHAEACRVGTVGMAELMPAALG